MKLTPLDIHHKEFRHALRGYSEEEVDQFLDEVADEFERLFKENIEIAEKLEAANQKLTEFELQRQTINNTLVAAQQSAENIVATANSEAETVLRDAELKAKEIIHEALTQKQKVQGELIRIKQAEEEFRARLEGMLDSYRGQIKEISLPEDVGALLQEPSDEAPAATSPAPSPIDEVFAAPVAEPQAPVAPPTPVAAEPLAESQFQPPAEPQAAPIESPAPLFDVAEGESAAVEVPAETPEPAQAPELAVEEHEEPAAVQPEPTRVTPEPAPDTAAAPAEGAPAEGVVESVALGELESPEIPEEPVKLGEPPEFSVPSLDVLGDRESDIDIEEID